MNLHEYQLSLITIIKIVNFITLSFECIINISDYANLVK